MIRWMCLLALVTNLFAHGDLHERIAAVTAQLQTNSTSPDLWLQRADLNRQHGEFSAAQTDLAHAAQLKPNWSATHLQQARISFDTENFPACERAATACVKLDATNADAFVLRARSRVQLKKFTRAAADYDAVLHRTNAAAPLPDLFLERARAHAAVKNFDDALHGLDDATSRLGETPSFALPAIEFERQRGTFDAALARLARAEKFFDHESYLALHGEIYLQIGRRAEAGRDFTDALAALEKFSTARRAQPSVIALEARLRTGLKAATVPTE